jgi:hypothetical protein
LQLLQQAGSSPVMSPSSGPNWKDGKSDDFFVIKPSIERLSKQKEISIKELS